ncbi:hypothetical protein ACEWET_02480 [Paraliobacillus sp. JSM ZJ581]
MVNKQRTDQHKLFFAEVITVVSKLLVNYEEGYTFHFEKTNENKTYQLAIKDDSYRCFKLKLTEKKVLQLKQKQQHALEHYICNQLLHQGFPII